MECKLEGCGVVEWHGGVVAVRVRRGDRFETYPLAYSARGDVGPLKRHGGCFGQASSTRCRDEDHGCTADRA